MDAATVVNAIIEGLGKAFFLCNHVIKIPEKDLPECVGGIEIPANDLPELPGVS